MGLILVIVGQLQIANPDVPLSPPLPLGEWLNNSLHLGIPSVDNVLRGLPILAVGGLLLILALRSLRVLPPREPPIDIRPFAIRLMRSAWPWVLTAGCIFAFLLFQLDRLDYRPITPLLWILTLLIMTTLIAVWDHRRQVSYSPSLTRQDLLWLVGLLIAGLLIGAYRLQGWPDQLMGDEGNLGSSDFVH